MDFCKSILQGEPLAELVIGYAVALFTLVQTVDVPLLFPLDIVEMIKLIVLGSGVRILFFLIIYAQARYRIYSYCCQGIIQYKEGDFEELQKGSLHMKIEESVWIKVKKIKIFGVPVSFAVKGELPDRMPWQPYAVFSFFPKRIRGFIPWGLYAIFSMILLLLLLI